MKSVIKFLWIILNIGKFITCFTNHSVFIDPASNTLSQWFYDLNVQYLKLNHYAALISWDLNVNYNSKYSKDAYILGKLRSEWRNKKCSQAKSIQNKNELNSIQNRMIYLLCRGPKNTNYQAGELSEKFSIISTIYTETQICLPRAFDVCLNYERIWDYTYKSTPTRELLLLDLSLVKPLAIDYNPLNLFDGSNNKSQDYYIFRGYSANNKEEAVDIEIRQSPMFCLSIEPELEDIMMGNFSSLRRNDCALPADVILRWAWESWRLAVGPDIGDEYRTIVDLMNIGAQNNGYHDIGEFWREELEIEDLVGTVNHLWQEVKPFYKLLHAVLRHALRKKYDGDDFITKNGPLPAHLLGEMWSADWTPYEDLLMPFREFRLKKAFEKKNLSSIDMVKRSEDFYVSLGLDRMTNKFWNNSQFTKNSNDNLTKCHGTAGNMFYDNDYRMIVCAENTIKDFYKIVHEMGHIEYYMNTIGQIPLFQDSANSAFGEAIGDTIFLAIMTPQHLNRLRIVPDEYLRPANLPKESAEARRAAFHTFSNNPLYNKAQIPKMQEITLFGKPITDFGKVIDDIKNVEYIKDKFDATINEFDLSLLLQMALSRIPQIPFEYILDKFRWDLFANKVNMNEANEYYWELRKNEQGIVPPGSENSINDDIARRKDLFDPGAKFHIADNTPYVRYFLSSFLQAQIFKGLCTRTVFEDFNKERPLPMPLHRCDIYGSRRAGKLLKKAMKLGSSTNWKNVLYILTGETEISSNALLEYYKPLIKWLEKLVIEFEIPLGW